MLDILAEAAKTSLGFFWKSGWAFVFGYAVSSMIQAFVPRDRLVAYMGDASPRSVGLARVSGMVALRIVALPEGGIGRNARLGAVHTRSESSP